MDLGKKIQQVLKHYPSVYVHGLGAFKKVHQASSFDEQHNVFLPPIDYVEFVDRDQEGLDLAEYLRQENEISRTDAKELVAREVASIVSNINEHGKAHIPQLGDLLTYGDGYVFRAIDLSSFVFEPISNIEQPVQKTEEPEQYVALPVDNEGESATETADSEEIDHTNTEEITSEDELEISPNIDEPAPEEHHIEEEVAPISEEEIREVPEEEPSDTKTVSVDNIAVESPAAEEVWESHVDVPESLATEELESDAENVVYDKEAESVEEVTASEVVLAEPVSLEEENNTAEQEVIHETHAEDVVAPEEKTVFAAQPTASEESGSEDLTKGAPAQEAPPLIQNKYQGSRSGVVKEDSTPTELIPSNENQEYTYASEYVEDNNRSHMIWYVLAAVVALSIIGALWYVTRPESLYSGVNDLDTEDARSNTYATEGESRIPLASTDVVDTSSVLRDRPDTANLGAQAPVSPPAGAAIQPVIPANHHWYIVIGSRLPLDDAEEMVTEFNKKGQPRVRLIPGRGLDSPATVIWDSYVSKEKTDSALRLVRKNFVADAWHKAVKK